MSALKTTTDQPALPVQPIARDQAPALLGEVMGFVAVTVGFTALGAYLGRDLSGATGLLLFIGAFACIVGLNIAAAKVGAFSIFDFNRLRRASAESAVANAASIFLDIFNALFLALELSGGRRE